MNRGTYWLVVVLIAGLALTAALFTLGQPARAATSPPVGGLYPTPAWGAEGTQDGAKLGATVATAGDVNGDGYQDVIVGEHGYDVLSDTIVFTDAGRAHLYLGSATGLGATPDWTFEGDQENAVVGYSVGTAGDVDGNGYDDVVVSAHGYDVGDSLVITNAGRVYLFFGSPAGLSGTPDWMVDGDQENGYMGYRVATAGNVNGDSWDDIIVGTPYYDNGHTDEGRVWVYHGSASGLGSTANWKAESNQNTTWFGNWVGSAGDVDDDGDDEVIVAAHTYDNGQFDEGAVFVWYGSDTGLGDDGTPGNADWLAESNLIGYSLGTGACGAGDVNNDGYDDVIIGAWLWNTGAPGGQGAVFAWYGSDTGLGANGNPTNDDWRLIGGQASSHLGYSMGAAGDVNADGYDDVLVAAFRYNNGQPKQGKAWLYLGGSGDLSSASSWETEGDQLDAEYGAWLGTAGDVDGDGYDDVLVGSQLYNTATNSDEGLVHLYNGWGCRAQIDGEATVYDTVQEAVNQAVADDLVKVSGYCPGTETRAGLTQNTYVTKTVTIQGGYLPDFSNDPDPDTYPTTIDAQGGGRGMVISGTISPVVEGMQITGGDAAGQGGIGEFGNLDGGGGIYIVSATATISHCTIFSNTAEGGAGLALHMVDATIRGNDIYSNTATGDGGGGLSVGGTGPAKILDNSIHDNVSTDGHGGGAACFYSSPTFSGNKVLDNTTNEDGGGISMKGCDGATIDGDSFNGNEAGGDGGGLYLDESQVTLEGLTVTGNNATTGSGGGIMMQDCDDAVLRNSDIMSNTAISEGAGVFLSDSDATLTGNEISCNEGNEGALTLLSSDAMLADNRIMGNTSSWRAGGLSLQDSHAKLHNTIITGNKAEWHGGGIRIEDSSPTFTNTVVVSNSIGEGGGVGSGILIDVSSVTMLHTTLANNTGSDEYGIFMEGSKNRLVMSNTILTHQGVGIWVESGTSATLDGVLWYDNSSGNSGGAGSFSGSNQLTANPVFATDGFHLTSASAAVDQGLDLGVGDDIDNELRPMGAAPDLGADEALCLGNLVLSGPSLGLSGTDYEFVAEVSPPTATLPIEYEWLATGLDSQDDSGGLQSTVSFSWSSGGAQQVTASASNGCPAISRTHTITICQQLTAVLIDGPDSGAVNVPVSFTVGLTPTAATGPFAYAWSPAPGSGQGTGEATYTWGTEGSQAISITVTNCGGMSSAQDDHTIAIGSGKPIVYLPVVLRSYP